MDLLIETTLALGAFIVGIVGNLIASEFCDRAPSMAHWLIVRAVDRLPERSRTRYAEEWFAHLDECVGRLGKLRHAMACYLGARALAAELGHCGNKIPRKGTIPWRSVMRFTIDAKGRVSARVERRLIESLKKERRKLLDEISVAQVLTQGEGDPAIDFALRQADDVEKFLKLIDD